MLCNATSATTIQSHDSRELAASTCQLHGTTSLGSRFSESMHFLTFLTRTTSRYHALLHHQRHHHDSLFSMLCYTTSATAIQSSASRELASSTCQLHGTTSLASGCSDSVLFLTLLSRTTSSTTYPPGGFSQLHGTTGLDGGFSGSMLCLTSLTRPTSSSNSVSKRPDFAFR